MVTLAGLVPNHFDDRTEGLREGLMSNDEGQARERLAELERRLPFPEGFSLEEARFRKVAVGELVVWMVELAAAVAPGTPPITARAAELGEFPVDRAFFGLLERVSIHHARTLPTVHLVPVRDRDGAFAGAEPLRRVFP